MTKRVGLRGRCIESFRDALILPDPQKTSEEAKAAAGFLAGFSGRNTEAYTLHLRQLIIWCDQHRLGLIEVARTHIALYARDLEYQSGTGHDRPSRLHNCPSPGSTGTRAEEGVIEPSPAAHVGASASITSLTPCGSTATSSALSSSRPGCRRLAMTRCARCSR